MSPMRSCLIQLMVPSQSAGTFSKSLITMQTLMGSPLSFGGRWFGEQKRFERQKKKNGSVIHSFVIDGVSNSIEKVC